MLKSVIQSKKAVASDLINRQQEKVGNRTRAEALKRAIAAKRDAIAQHREQL
jgi:hypothetical protein